MGFLLFVPFPLLPCASPSLLLSRSPPSSPPPLYLHFPSRASPPFSSPPTRVLWRISAEIRSCFFQAADDARQARSTECGWSFKENQRLPVMLSVVGVLLAANVLLQPASAAEQGPPPAEKNEFIQKLLEKSRANKEKYDKERRDAYYKRNYKDYFEFVEGSIRSKSEPSETEKRILQWLEKNR